MVQIRCIKWNFMFILSRHYTAIRQIWLLKTHLLFGFTVSQKWVYSSNKKYPNIHEIFDGNRKKNQTLEVIEYQLNEINGMCSTCIYLRMSNKNVNSRGTIVDAIFLNIFFSNYATRKWHLIWIFFRLNNYETRLQVCIVWFAIKNVDCCITGIKINFYTSKTITSFSISFSLSMTYFCCWLNSSTTNLNYILF